MVKTEKPGTEMQKKIQDAIEKGEHVGAFIQRELIEPSEQTLEFIADQIGVHWKSISHVKNGDYRLSPEMAAKLSNHFGTYTAEQLLTIQAVHDGKKADQTLLVSLGKHKDPTGNQRRDEVMQANKIQDAIANGEHVGSFIQRELIEPSEQTLEFIAGKIGVHWISISYMRSGRYKLSSEMASKLSRYFGTYSTQELLSVQAAYDGKKADTDSDLKPHESSPPAPVQHKRGMSSRKAMKAAVKEVVNRITSNLEKELTALFSEVVAQRLQRIEQHPAPYETDMQRKIRESIESGEHPVEFICRELIEPSGQKLQFIANKIGIHPKSLTYLNTQQRSLSPKMAAKLSHYFGTYTTQQLLSLQSAHDAKKADQTYESGLSQNDDPAPV